MKWSLVIVIEHFTFMKYFDISTKEVGFLILAILNPRNSHTLYTLGIKERMENMDLGKDWIFLIKWQKEYEHSQR